MHTVELEGEGGFFLTKKKKKQPCCITDLRMYTVKLEGDFFFNKKKKKNLKTLMKIRLTKKLWSMVIHNNDDHDHLY